MSKAAFDRIAGGLKDVHVIIVQAKHLYAEAGNPPEDWPVVDECVRAHFLIAAADGASQPAPTCH